MGAVVGFLWAWCRPAEFTLKVILGLGQDPLAGNC
jgi:hypothetical protein